MKENKNKRITVRLTESDYQKIVDAAAEFSNANVGEFCRAKILDEKIKVDKSGDKNSKHSIYEREIRGQYFGMANNLNQISKNINIMMRQGIIEPEEALKILTDLEDWHLTHKNLKTEILKALE